MHPGTYTVHFLGKILTQGSWDNNEEYTVTMKDQYGRVLAETTMNGQGREVHDVRLSADYNPAFNGDVTVRISNNLDEDVNNEAIGWSELRFGYEYDPTVTEREENPFASSPADYDYDHSDPTSLWENDCDATSKTCSGLEYWGGKGECGTGNTFHRTFEARKMHPATNKLRFVGKIWTVDSWDGETFTIEIVDEDGDVLGEKTLTGNNFQELGA
jgi:hypothetical protein